MDRLSTRKIIPTLIACLTLTACVSQPSALRTPDSIEAERRPVLGFGHVALTVANIEHSTRWYDRALDLKLLGPSYDVRVDESPLGKVASALFGPHVRHLKIAQLQTPNGQMRVELFEFVEPRPTSATHPVTSGFIHLAVVVVDFDAAVQRMEAAGARYIVTNDANPQRRVAFFADPDGNVIEIDAAPWPVAAIR